MLSEDYRPRMTHFVNHMTFFKMLTADPRTLRSRLMAAIVADNIELDVFGGKLTGNVRSKASFTFQNQAAVIRKTPSI